MQAPFSRFGVPIEKGVMVIWEVVVLWFHKRARHVLPLRTGQFQAECSDRSQVWKSSKHSGHSCPHPERLELPKMIHRQRLQRQFPDQSMGVLLKIEGNCSCLKAKVAH